LLLLALAGCTARLSGGVDGDDTDTPTGKGVIVDDQDVQPTDCAAANAPLVAPTVLRRLTARQYDRTVIDVLGETRRFGESFPTATREAGYDNQSTSQHVQRVEVDAWELAAQEMARAAISTSPLLLPCGGESAFDEACFRTALPQLAMRLLRRPLPEADLERYLAFFDERLAESDAPRAARLTLETLLLSPRFLFVVEEGTPTESDPALRRLDGFELASRLSLLLWNTGPNEELLDRAARGELETPEQVLSAAASMLSDARAADVALDFHSQWIDLAEVDDMILPEGTDEMVRVSARVEVERFLENWFLGGDARLADLFLSRSSWLDEALADYYGVATPDGATEVTLPEDQRAGLLTRAVFLGTHSIPPTRGDFILDRVLCSPVPPLSIVPPPAPDLGPSATTRERFERHSEDPCAAGCHDRLDPIGFSFEHYDAMGRYRTHENDIRVDATAMLPFGPESGLSGKVDGAIELSRAIAESPLASDCWAENWFRYAHGRGATAVDRCSLERAEEALASSGGQLRRLLEAMTTTDAFLFVRKD
jgi:hypothetical protein